MRYDVSEIRRCARDLDRIVFDLRSSAQRVIRQTEEALYPEFRGLAAEAFKKALLSLDEDIGAIIKSLDGIGNELNSFARRLAEADRLAREQIGAKRES